MFGPEFEPVVAAMANGLRKDSCVPAARTGSGAGLKETRLGHAPGVDTDAYL
jgi:hypothetical protein